MSLVNLLGNLLTPSNSKIYLVRSRELEEALLYTQCEMDGAVGRLVQIQPEELKVEDHSKPFTCYISSLIPDSDQLHIHRVTPRTERTAIDISEYTLGYHEGRDTKINVPACSHFETHESIRWSYEKDHYWLICAVVALGVIPYVIIAVLTEFHPGQSRRLQQVFTMFWLASGVVIGGILPFYKFNTDIIRDSFSLLYPLDLSWWDLPFFVFLFLLLFSAAAVGGFVVVGSMLKDYGSCVEF
ncbi:MAG: hypothetical protein MMC33_000485 [Icmadophila ericetorum]|nr:hypothetical protein [Icmadophila ericetorum]